METLAPFRPDLGVYAELDAIVGDNDFVPTGKIPSEWLAGRLLGTAFASGEYADIYSSEWVSRLRRELAPYCRDVNLPDLDASVLQGAHRSLTQQASRIVYEDRNRYAGIRYLSRYGHDIENWALFEPFQITIVSSDEISIDDADLQHALEILHLQFA